MDQRWGLFLSAEVVKALHGVVGMASSDMGRCGRAECTSMNKLDWEGDEMCAVAQNQSQADSTALSLVAWWSQRPSLNAILLPVVIY